MKPEATFLSQPIRSLQTMLRVLAEEDNRYETLVPDGIYGPATVSAVSRFQRLNALPITGVTDQQTWDRIVLEYGPARISREEAAPLNTVLNPGQVIRKGQRHPSVHLTQAMLAVLQEVYESLGPVTHTGILDGPTSDALSAFQQLSLLPMTGQLDKRTWKHLTLHYPLAAVLAESGEKEYIPDLFPEGA